MALQKLRIGLEWFKNPDHTPFIVANELGWFAEAGLEVELIEPDLHMDAIDQINDGEIDLAITEPLHLIEDRAKGRKAVGFARYFHTNGGVMYIKGKGISRPRDMERKGLRIQYPNAPGPGGPAIVSTMIEADGGGPVDVSIFGRTKNGFMHTDALATDKADVATLAFVNFELIEAKHHGLDVDFFALKDYGVPDFNQLVLTSTEEGLLKNREPIAALIKVLGRAIRYIAENRAEAKSMYFKQTNTAIDDAFRSECWEATVNYFTLDFTMPEDFFEHLSEWMFRRGLTPKKIDPKAEKIWSNDLL